MSSVMNRFSCLQMDVRNPTDKPGTKQKVKKEYKKTQRPKPVEKEAPLLEHTEKINTEKVVQQKTSVPIIVTDRKINRENKDFREEYKTTARYNPKRDYSSRENEGVSKSTPATGVEDGGRSYQRRDYKNVKPHTNDASRQPESNLEGNIQQNTNSSVAANVAQDYDETVDTLQQDDRAIRSRHTYQKMAISRGRMYDRQGGPKTRIKPLEKKGGHGLYNWGDQDTHPESIVEGDSTTLVDGDGSRLKTGTAVPDPEPVEYTLSEYKEMVKENKVAPVFHEHLPVSKSGETKIVEKPESNFKERQYEYQRPSEGRSGRGRDGYSRGSRGNTRGPRGGHRGRGDGSYEYRNREGSGNNQRRETTKELHVDDISDFPNL